jgi:hypothetical protein
MITESIPFPEAVRFLLDKEDLPAEWDAADWTAQEPDFRNRAFWSAKVENARFLDRAHGLIFDYMAKVRETIVQPDGTVVTALKVGGRADFTDRMTKFMIAEGMAKPGEFVNVDQKDLTDIRSVARLRLIFDTNVRQAYGYGQWKQGMKPAVLRAFPAARLIRERGVKEPRPRHQNNLGEVRLKTDPRWAEFHNAREIGGFGVPWGPYGFQSGVTQEDVSRREAIKLGLMVDIRNLDATPADVSRKRITDGLEASVKGMDPAIKAKLLEELRAKKAALGNPIERAGEAGRRAGENARREMLSRGLADAEARGDAGKAAKYRKAIAELPDAGLKVRDDGDKIVLETASNTGIVPALPDDSIGNHSPKDPVLPQQGKDRALVDAADDFRRVLHPDGEILGQEDYLDRSEQIQIIEREARRLGVLYDGLEPLVEGGREHDLIYDDATGTVLKFTKPSSSAYVVEFLDGKPRLSNGDPVEYLERLILHNEVFGEFTRFVGIGGMPNNRRIITRQDRVKGREARWDEIISLMVDDLGFTKLRHNYGIGYEDSFAFIREDVAVFDMRPANLFKTNDGILIAIDSIPVRLNDATQGAFGQ